MNWMKPQINRWNNNHATARLAMADETRRTFRRMDRIAGNIGRLILMGLIVNVIGSYFYPEFPERFPVIYGWFDGWLQLGELALKAGLGSTYAIITGNFGEFWVEYRKAVNEAIRQFYNWLSLIHF